MIPSVSTMRSVRFWGFCVAMESIRPALMTTQACGMTLSGVTRAPPNAKSWALPTFTARMTSNVLTDRRSAFTRPPKPRMSSSRISLSDYRTEGNAKPQQTHFLLPMTSWRSNYWSWAATAARNRQNDKMAIQQREETHRCIGDHDYNLSMLTCRLAALLCFLLQPLLVAQEANVLAEIKEQAFTHSQAAEDIFYLADVFGPRFMDSPGYVKAGDWAVGRLQTYGLAKVAKEYFTTRGPGWGFSGVSVEMVLPAYSRMGAFPLARSIGTNGVVSGEPLLAVITTEQEYQQFVARYEGKLKGKIVLMDPIQPIQARTWEGTHTLTESEVLETTWPPSPGWRPTMTDAQYREMERLQAKTAEFLASESVGVEIRSGIGDEDFPADTGVIRGTYSAEMGKTSPPAVVVEAEQYNRLVRLVSHGVPVELRVSTSTSFYDTARSFNVVAEIPGTDRRDEFVMF